jgi:uncharacterized membrane protein YhaH (DUF805 family)
MDIFQATSTCIKKYADFSGRAGRSEFWWFFLSSSLLMLAFETVSETLGNLASLFFFLPNLAVSARRLHDMNHTGWWLLLHLTGIGSFVLYIWFMFAGDRYVNNYGLPENTANSNYPFRKTSDF